MPERRTPVIRDILSISGAIVVNGTGTAYSRSFPLLLNRFNALEYQFSSGGTINVKVELEIGNTPPGTEQASDTDWVVADSFDEIAAAVTDANVHFKEVVPVPAVYGRLKLTGLSGNASTTQLDRANWMDAEQQ